MLVVTREPVLAAQRITSWAIERGVELGHFSVNQPTLEDIYLELTGSAARAQTSSEEVTGMSSVARRPSLRRDLGLVVWQIRYEQRAYWRNRGRGIFTFVFPLMFLVIFASLNKGAHLHALGGTAVRRLLRAGDPRLRDHRRRRT